MLFSFTVGLLVQYFLPTFHLSNAGRSCFNRPTFPPSILAPCRTHHLPALLSTTSNAYCLDLEYLSLSPPRHDRPYLLVSVLVTTAPQQCMSEPRVRHRVLEPLTTYLPTYLPTWPKLPAFPNLADHEVRGKT
ncbi:hypothetical protein BDW02DRAFT_569623 [Decorospora gaudefroyi]|uniref:Uncharacterized protein n=1 Tax=Decorospora gaudefroyi TaxID=184978 RepID=A0A6A5K964_9PLEO|nr:hypothetical protein BDW02DRAFT_569623 [Decorospora gaudefroyi]